MEKFGNFLVFILMFILGCLATTLAGALIGLVVGWFFGGSLLSVFAAIGISGFKMWEIGAALGFIGSFFRSNVYNYSLKQQEH